MEPMGKCAPFSFLVIIHLEDNLSIEYREWILIANRSQSQVLQSPVNVYQSGLLVFLHCIVCVAKVALGGYDAYLILSEYFAAL